MVNYYILMPQMQKKSEYFIPSDLQTFHQMYIIYSKENV